MARRGSIAKDLEFKPKLLRSRRTGKTYMGKAPVKLSRFRGPGLGKQCPKCSAPNRRACRCRVR